MTGKKADGRTDVESILSTLAEPVPEPSTAVLAWIEGAMTTVADELRAAETEREMAPYGLVPVYRFARNHLKGHFFPYLAGAAAALAVILRAALGPAFPRFLQFLVGGW
ncbi:MAG TPA: hypothetical protein VGL40_02930 [Bacillota bacterium]